jgi:ABC-2 type transport system ATP-binding protein
MMANIQTIIVEGLRKDFGDFTAVNGVDFHVNQGEIFGFLGPNGSGKTTTIRMMLGLLTPTEGDVQVLNIPVIDNPGALRSKVGYMSQHFSLYNDLTVEQNLRFYGTAYGLSNAELKEQMKVSVELAGLAGREFPAASFGNCSISSLKTELQYLLRLTIWMRLNIATA